MRVKSDTKTTDQNIRLRLAQELSQNETTSAILHEFDVVSGRARADVVAIANNRIHAYEIKSDADNLSRLPSQVRYYNQVFASVTLVVGDEHVVSALYIIPDWWGVVVARVHDDEVILIPVRDARENRSIDYKSVSALLHKEELIQLLTRHSRSGNLASMSKLALQNKVKEEIAPDLLLDCLPDLIGSRSLRMSCA